MTDPLTRARQILDDPRPPQWLTQPGQATELLGVLRGVVDDLDLLVAHTTGNTTLLQEMTRQLNRASVLLHDQHSEIDRLAESCAKVLQLHKLSADGSCSSCRIPHPCHTSQAITARERV